MKGIGRMIIRGTITTLPGVTGENQKLSLESQFLVQDFKQSPLACGVEVLDVSRTGTEGNVRCCHNSLYGYEKKQTPVQCHVTNCLRMFQKLSVWERQKFRE
jgi:hypothetical protein